MYYTIKELDMCVIIYMKKEYAIFNSHGNGIKICFETAGKLQKICKVGK